MQIERRKFIRFDVPLDLEFRPSKDRPEYVPGTTINFSREGFCFETESQDLRLNETMELKVRLPHKESFVPVVGEIVWKRQLENRCLAGIQLEAMDKEAKSEILDHAYNIWLEKTRH